MACVCDLVSQEAWWYSIDRCVFRHSRCMDRSSVRTIRINILLHTNILDGCMTMLRNIPLVAKIIVACTFIVSAVTKLYDFKDTARYFADLSGVHNYIMHIGLIIIIFIEMIIAIIVLSGQRSAFFYRSTLALLIFFTIINVIFAATGVSNCACLGAKFIISPLESAVKNVFLILALHFLEKWDIASYNQRQLT